MIPNRFGFYAVLTNPTLGYEYLTRTLVDHGIAFVQLRIKDGTREEIVRTAQVMRKITEGSSTRFIVNDHPDIARDVGADGVHVGQSDMSIDMVRAIVGPEAIIGLSTHSPLQTETACKSFPSYIGVGPVFATPTKKNPDPVIGIDGMKTMLSIASVPAVAIGGIDLTNLRSVLDAGAQNFCMVRQLTHSSEPAKVLAEAVKIYREYYPA